MTTFAGVFAAHKVYDANPKRCIMGIQVSIYKNSFDTTGVSVSLSAVVNHIRSGAKGLAETTRYCQAISVTDPDKYRTYKSSQLPAVTFSGVFPTNQRKAHAIAHHSGLITLDIDEVPDSAGLLSELHTMPEVVIAFVSPSGTGIKAVVSVDPIPIDAIEHKGAWQACADRFDDLAMQYEFTVDVSGKDASRLCYLAYDPQIITHENPVAIAWDREEYLESLHTPESTHAGVEYTGAVDIAALDHISADVGYQDWLNVGLACHHSGVPLDVWESWSKQSAKYQPGECAKKWESFGSYTGQKITWGSVVHRAKQNGYTPRRTRQAPIRLSHQPDYQPESETLDTLRKALPVGLLEWQERTAETDRQHMLILAFGAGTGKSTASIINLKQYADISPTIELADEKYHKALFEGVHAMRHRSRNYNRKEAENFTPETVPIGLEAESGAVPCAFPDICNGLAEKGYSASSLFCPGCPRYDECRADGYLSQWNLMPKHDAIFFSYQDDFFSDPKYRSHIETLTKGKDAVLVLDEADPASLPPKREYTTEYLKQLCERFGSLDAGVFLGMLIEKTAKAITPHDWTVAITNLLAKFDDAELDAIDIELEAIPVKTRFEKAQPAVCDLAGVPLYKTIAHITYGGQERTCAVLSRRKGEKQPPIATFEMLTNDDANWVSDAIIPKTGWQFGKEYESLLTINTFCKLGFGSLDTAETVDRLPNRLSNFTADLRAYVQSVNSETPACYEEKDGKAHLGWVYYLRPGMNARRGVLISAGGIEDIIKEQYAHTEIEIEVMDGKPAAWKPGNVLFQLTTGRYTPAQKWIERDDDYNAIGLRDAGKAVMKMIAKEAETGKQTLIVGSKDFTHDGKLTHVPELANLLAMDNVFSINHYHAEGVNQYDFCEIAFIFLYEPRPDELKWIASRIYRDNTLCFDREKMTIQKSGVELEDVLRYTDPRVQSCFDKECEKRLMQAITRLRQMINENKRVYLLTSEPVSSLPVTPRLCTLDDIKACQVKHGTLDSLEAYIEEKETMSIDETAQQDGVSDRTAYRRTETKRKGDKSELKSEAYRLYHEEEKTHREIAAELGVKTHSTISRWLASYQF